MPLTARYTPPALDAIALLHSAAELGLEAAGKHLLDASQQLVPEDTGRLKQSGQSQQEGLEVAVSYGREDGDGTHAPTAAYATVQHENMDFAHPNGGSAKFLETPMHSEAGSMLAAIAEPLRVLFR